MQTANGNSPAVAVVTGGASGIGLLVARDLVNKGSKVAIIDINEEALQRVASEHERLYPFACDLSDQQAAESVVSQVVATLGPIDRLVHCAAIMPADDLASMSTGQVNRIMSVNYMGTVNITKSVLPDMLDRDRGEIAVIGSMAGSVLTHGLGAYCASKAATNTYMEVLQQENRGNNVHILLICPPMVNTPLLDQAVDTGPASMSQARAENRMVEPGVIVDAINRGLDQRIDIVCPGEAKFMMWLRRFSPALLWWLMRKANGRPA